MKDVLRQVNHVTYGTSVDVACSALFPRMLWSLTREKGQGENGDTSSGQTPMNVISQGRLEKSFQSELTAH